MKIKMCTAAGEEHGLINTLTNSVPDTGFKHIDPKIKSQLEKKKKDDARIVKARYLNSRGMHERLTKPYCKYAGDPIDVYHLIPGHTYDLPMGMIEEVNDCDVMPQRSGLIEVDGKDVTRDGSPLQADKEGIRLHQLVPASF